MIKVHFINGENKELELHYLNKEYRNDIYVEIDGLFFEVYFFTPQSLQYEFSEQGYFAYPGIIMLDKITTLKITNSIKELSKLNYFSWFNGKNKINCKESFLQKCMLNDLSSNLINLVTIIL